MIDLQKFCAHATDIRPYLRQPFAHLGYRYAANGHILVRVPAPEESLTNMPTKVMETIEAMFAGIAAAEYRPLPDFELGPMCPCCGGKGEYRESECKDCHGTGCGSRQHRDCRTCKGTGSVQSAFGELCECQECWGHGRDRRRVTIDGVDYDSNYLNRICALEGHAFATQGAKAAHFKFTGGEGFLMPMQPIDARL